MVKETLKQLLDRSRYNTELRGILEQEIQVNHCVLSASIAVVPVRSKHRVSFAGASLPICKDR